MTHIETMKLALEALTHLQPTALTSFYTIGDRDKAITSLRQAIEQTQQAEPVAMRYDFDGYGYKYIDSGSGSDWQTRIQDAEPVFAQPQEPVIDKSAAIRIATALVWTPPREWVGLTDEEIKQDFEKWAKANCLQGLEPYGDSYHNAHTRNRWQGWLAAYRAIEAKLKEKNT